MYDEEILQLVELLILEYKIPLEVILPGVLIFLLSLLCVICVFAPNV